MHFDDGTRHADDEKYGRTNPTAKRKTEAGAAAAAPAVARSPLDALARTLLLRQPGDPEIHPAAARPAELRAERTRLDSERSNLHHSTTEPESEARYDRYATLINRLDVLLAERGNSTLADAQIELRFDGRALTMAGSSAGAWSAVSGRPAADGASTTHPLASG